MAIFCLPLIVPEQYDAFRRLMGANLPNTYDEWLQLAEKKRCDYLRLGHQTKEIRVDADEFASAIRAGRYANDVHALQYFAADLD